MLLCIRSDKSVHQNRQTQSLPEVKLNDRLIATYLYKFLYNTIVLYVNRVNTIESPQQIIVQMVAV